MKRPPLTAVDLDALPVGTDLADADGDVWRKHASGRWGTAEGLPRSPGLPSGRLIALYGPMSEVAA